MTFPGRRAARAVTVVATAMACAVPGLAAQVPVGREALERIRYPELRFDPPEAQRREMAGVPVFYLRDEALPLTTVFVRFRGGYGRFPRSYYAAGTALPSLLRYGGTRELSPDSVDILLESMAVQTSFGGSGEALSSSLDVLTEVLDPSLELWTALLTRPRWDSAEIAVWRGRQAESIRRRADDPARLAFSEFNRLLYGDHPIGWEMELADLEGDRLAPERFAELHARIVCREHMVLGATGDLSFEEMAPRLQRLVSAVPPCAEELPPPPEPQIRHEPGVWLIQRDLDQAVIVMAHATGVRLSDDREYFAATIGNAILGGGGFSSRLLSRVRTQEGYAYTASSLWTTPRRYDGLLGAITRTRPDRVVPAIELILEVMQDLRRRPPSEEEVRTSVDQIVNSFVFNFESPAQVLSRTMFYTAQDLPDDWLRRYLRGVQRVRPGDVLDVFRRWLRPDEMMILVVGDASRMGGDELARFGPVRTLEIRRPDSR